MAGSIKMSPMIAPFIVDAKGLKQLDSIEKRMGEFGKALGGHMMGAGRALTASVTLPVLGLGAASAKMAVGFNKSMAQVGTLIPGQSDKLNRMKRGVQDLAITSGIATDTLSEGLYQTISALGDTEDSMSQLQLATNAAKAGAATTKDAIDLLAMGGKAYGDTSTKALTKLSDLAFMTVKLGVTTFPELAQSMGKVMSKSKELGVSQEELFASFAALTGVTGNTSEVSTQLTAVLGGMVKPTQGMIALAEKLEYASAAAMMQEKGFAGVLQILQKETGGSVAELGKLFESKEALGAVIALNGSLADQFNDKLGAMQDASGATAAALNEQENGINKAGAAWDRMKQRLQVFMQRLGDRLIPLLERLMDLVTPTIDGFLNMSDATVKSGIKMAAMAAAVGPALMVLGKLVSIIGGVTSAISGAGGLSVVLAAATGPVGIAIAAVAALTAAIIYFHEELEPVGRVFKQQFLETARSVSAPLNMATGSTANLGQSMKQLVKSMAPAWAMMAKVSLTLATLPLKPVIENVKRLVSVFQSVFSVLSDVFNIFSMLLTFAWDAVSKKFGSMVDTLLQKIPGLQKVGKALSWVLSGLKAVTVDLLPNIGNLAAAGAGSLKDTVQSATTEGPRTSQRQSARQQVDVNLKVDANGAKVGSSVSGGRAKVTRADGAIMAPGATI